MHGQTSVGSAAGTEAGRRIFRVEVTGLRQGQGTDLNAYPIRQSGSTFVTVPYSKLNEEMRRISRLGGKIVAVEPVVI